MGILQATPTAPKPVFGLDADKAFSAPLGAVSPLWLTFVGAASAGVAYWWFTRWMRPAEVANDTATALLTAGEDVVPVLETVAETEQAAAETVAVPVVAAAAEILPFVEPATTITQVETLIEPVATSEVTEALVGAEPEILPPPAVAETAAAPLPKTVEPWPAPAAPSAKTSTAIKSVAAPAITAKTLSKGAVTSNSASVDAPKAVKPAAAPKAAERKATGVKAGGAKGKASTKH